KELEFVAVRDQKDTALFFIRQKKLDEVLSRLVDSNMCIPARTITDQEYQQFRSATLKIMRKLHLTGSCHVQFALDPTTQNYYVIKVTPYFDRTMALAARATEYPLAQVVGNLMVGISLAEVKLPGAYRKQTALIEPVSGTKQCIVEQSIVGYKELEFVAVRDQKDTALLVSGMENFDPVGIHSADSIVFAPTQTITDQEYQQFRSATLKIMRKLHLTGSCHVQFA
ncbi:hypothetical protein WP50_20295, partial [Lactiplantibacillus plantarum]